MTRSNLKAAAPWLVLLCFLLIPIYGMSVVAVLRSGLFDLSAGHMNDEQFKAVWAFIASGLGTAVTIIGLLFTKSHNERTLALKAEADKRKGLLEEETSSRLTLDTAVKGLELLVNADGTYASKAKISGGLAVLVHLGHPIIAMRTLSAMWDDHRVDLDTATWLIGEVFKTGTDPSKTEAAYLLLLHADELTDSQRKGWFYWPNELLGSWRIDIPAEAKGHILTALMTMLLSRERAWWLSSSSIGWVLYTLDEIVDKENEASIKASATVYLNALLALESDIDHRSIVGPYGWKALSEIRTRAEQTQTEDAWAVTSEIIGRIEAWARGVPGAVSGRELAISGAGSMLDDGTAPAGLPAKPP
jgi:hypothetical protein